MEEDVKEKSKGTVQRKSMNLKKELDVGAEESGGQDKNGSTKRQHPTSTKHKSTSSPRSSSSTTQPAPLSPSSITSAPSIPPPAVTETPKRRSTSSSQPSSRASSDSREPRAKGTKVTAGGDDGHHNGAAPSSSSSSENPLKKSSRSSSSLATQLQHSPATKPKSPHPTKEASAPLEEEEDDDSDDDLVITLRPPAAQSQPAGKAPGAASKAAAGGKKETRSSGSNSNKESVGEGEAGSGARRRSMDASPAGAVGAAAAAAGGKTEPVRRRQPTERRDRSKSARLDVRVRSYTADPRSPTGSGGGGQRMSSPNVRLGKEGSHSARESTSRDARDEEATNDDEEAVRSNASKNRRERNSQDLKKTLSTGSIRTNVEKDASTKDSKSGGSKQSKSNRDLNKLCQEDKADRKKALGEASPTRPARRRTTTTQSGAIATLRVTKRDRKDEDDHPASPGGNRSSRREEAEPAGDEGSADGKRGASAASTTKSRPDSGRDKRERPRGERAKDGGYDQHQAKDSPTTSDRRSSRPTSVRISKGADAGGARKERRHDEESNGGGEDDDSSFLTSSGGITPGRESRTTSSPIDDEDEDDEDSTASYTTPRDHSSNTNGGGAKSRRMSLKVRENGVSNSEEQRKRGSGGSSGRRRVGSGNREREGSEEEENKDSKTEEEQDNDGQLDSDEEAEEAEEECMLDAATVEYNARLRKFILACVENLMKTVTRWAVVVSTPFAIAGELRVVDITRYVNGTLTILDGLKLGHRSQRSASGRDLSASKVDKSVQNPVHVAVNILLKRLLKIKNRVNTLSSKRLPHFYQAFYAVQNFHETGEAPRDNSSVHLPLKSTMPDSSIDATLVAAQFGDDPLPTPSPRPNPFEFPSGTDVQVEYMLEPMKCRIGSSGAKNRTLVLQRSNLLVFPKNRSKCKDDKPVKVHDLRNTKAISPSYVNKTATKIKPQSFCVLTVEDEEIEIEAASKETMAAWALALDGLCMPNYSTHLNAQFRSELLQYVGKNVYKGGVIKSSYEEEWSYFANGTLERAEPLNGRRLAYTWDGEVLQPLRAKDAGGDSCGPSLGTGRWNGVWLSWYRGDYLSEDPVIRYFWLPTEKEFQTSNPLLTWKWTRHFLASKYGSGEWIMEGEVPSPVVMCLQLMRYAAAIRAEELSRQLTAAPSVLSASSRGSKS